MSSSALARTIVAFFIASLTATAHHMHTKNFHLQRAPAAARDSRECLRFSFFGGRAVDDDGLKILLERSKTCQLSAFDTSHLFLLPLQPYDAQSASCLIIARKIPSKIDVDALLGPRPKHSSSSLSLSISRN